jgi:hypothetical protein
MKVYFGKENIGSPIRVKSGDTPISDEDYDKFVIYLPRTGEIESERKGLYERLRQCLQQDWNNDDKRVYYSQTVHYDSE